APGLSSPEITPLNKFLALKFQRGEAMVMRMIGLLFAILFAIPGFGAPQGPAGQTIALRCGNLFDGRTDSLRKHAVIVVEGEKIKDVGSNVPQGTEVIDLSSQTCVPGLIDTHTHILLQGDITAADYDEQLLKQSPEYRTILATVNARRALEYGFT